MLHKNPGLRQRLLENSAEKRLAPGVGHRTTQLTTVAAQTLLGIHNQ
jgi:hypothetical protein